MTLIDRIAQLLVSGMQPALVASVVNVSKSYIAELLADADFKEALKELAQQNNETPLVSESQAVADKLTGLAHATMDQLLTRVQTGIMDDRNLILTLTTVNNMQEAASKREAIRNGLSNAGLGTTVDGVSVRIVEISMPKACIPDFTINNNSEIIAIGNRSTSPMPAASLKKILDADSLPAIEGESYHEQAI